MAKAFYDRIKFINDDVVEPKIDWKHHGVGDEKEDIGTTETAEKVAEDVVIASKV